MLDSHHTHKEPCQGVMGRPEMRVKLTRIRQIVLLCIIMIIVYSMSVGINTEIDCFQFCLGNTCFSSRLTVLIYRRDVSPKDMDFEQNFRPRVGPYRYVVDHLLDRYDPESCSMDDGYFSKFTTIPPQNNCAIIGNGGILLHSYCGKEIDSYDYVIRVNVPPLLGFEDDVGYKTNLTLLNFETLVYMHSNLTKKNIGDKFHDMYVNRVWRLNDSILWYAKSMGPRETRKRLQQSVDILKTKYLLPIRIAYSWRPLRPEKFVSMKRLATSGFNAYYVAKSLCQHVTLYGFYPSKTDARGFHLPHHYFEDVPYEYVNRVHNLLGEFQKYQEYQKEGQLRLVTEKCANYMEWKRQEEHERPVGDFIWFNKGKT